jgi:hypothetical protein
LPVTIAAASTGLAITESQVLGGAGTVAQYIRGDGSLADFPATTGGGSSVSYYLNGSVSQGTIGGVAYKELNRTPVFGAGTDISINADGYIASFITDAGDPNKLLIPAGNWNLETYFSASSGGGSPTFYVELYKYDGTTFTLIASSSSSPELIAFGTNLNPYFSTLAVPETILTLTDRLALRYYVNTSGRTITLHTENDHLCQVITTFTTGLTALNGLTTQVQFFAVGTSGTDFNISSSVDTHTFNLPTASASNRGALSSADWSTFNGKQNALTLTTTGTSGAATLVGSTLNIPQYQSVLTNPVTGTGTTNYLPKFTGSTTIGNSVIADNASEINIPKRIFLNSGSESIFLTPNLSSASNRIEGSSGVPLEITTGGSSLKFAAGGTTPQFTLASSGAATFTGSVTASSIIKSGGTSTQYLMADGSVSTLTNPVTGTGTTNYLPKFTGSTTVGNSQVFDNGTNVGINQAIPTRTLDILGASGIGTVLKLQGASGTTTYLQLAYNGATNAQSGYIGYDSSSNMTLFTNDTERMRITSGGNVGIGTASPTATLNICSLNSLNSDTIAQVITRSELKIQYRLDDLSSMYFGGLGSQRGYIQGVNNAENAGSDISINPYGGNVGIGTTSPGASLHVNANNSLNEGVAAAIIRQSGASGNNGIVVDVTNTPGIYIADFRQNNSSLVRIASNGNLLVGTTTDAGFKLDVNGTGRFKGASASPTLTLANSTGGTLVDFTITENTGLIVNSYEGASARSIDFRVAGISALLIASTGAATFSSSVTTATFLRAASGAQSNPTGGASVAIDYQSTSDLQGRIRSRDWDGAAWRNLTIEANNIILSPAGNVGIGTTSPAVSLHVQKNSGTYELIQIQNNSAGALLRAIGSGGGSADFGADDSAASTALIRTASTERMRITSGGEVLIGTTTNSATSGVGNKFVSNGRLYSVSSLSDNTQESLSMYSTGAANYRFYVGWGGTIYATSTSISGISDISLKTNIRDLEKGLTDILKLKPRKFDWKNGDGINNIGFIAQEIEKVFPELISEYKYNEYTTKKSLKMGDLIPSLVKAIQELKQEIDTLKN